MTTTARHDLASARRLLPLIRVISSEVQDRRKTLAGLRATQRSLSERADRVSPEGFTRALHEIDEEIRVEERGLDDAVAEFEALDLDVRSIEPLVIHIPGRTSDGDVVFCWEEGRTFTEPRNQDENPTPNPQPPLRGGSTPDESGGIG